MSPFDRETLRQLYQFRCGYCGTSEIDVGAELEIDHYQPRSIGKIPLLFFLIKLFLLGKEKVWKVVLTTF
ncbi:hypothetical protein FJZ31_30790 [Candidatus Poribacteria bacterium]|nr:hypothetical protein [Candidatus Poribacteria bacterium]